jgi:hypothetical protein
MTKPVEIDLTPIYNFHYIQVSNFSFQYLLLGANNQALHSPFECKDYLQDIFWSEFTGNVAKTWGIEWTQGMLDSSQKVFKLAMLGATEHKLNERISPMRIFLRHFETALGFKKTVIVPSSKPEYIVVKFSRDWLQSPLLLSAYTTLIRISGDYQGEEPIEYFTRLKSSKNHLESLPNYIRHDVERIEYTIGKFAALLQGIKPTKTWASLSSVHEAHNEGIAECQEFPTVNL